MEEICPIEQCTGCTACLNACAKTAISMQPDNIGFMYPRIDKSLCVNCGLCKKSCPNNLPVAKRMPIKSFVGHAVNTEEQLSSTSGGIASVISRWCIHQGGVVYGCSAKECTHIKHIRVTCEEDLIYLKGSKYVQSDMNTCYSQVRKDLRDNRMVVFIGTPCQCAGLKCYLKKEYENLYLVDFVCHGVPSQMVLNEELKLHSTVNQLQSASLSFRRKVKSGKKYRTQYGIFLQDDKGASLCEEVFPDNTYMTGFLTALFYRNSCYKCHYTTPERISDITLGDFGDHNKEYESIEGKKRLLSMVTVNTPNGESILSSICDLSVIDNIDYQKLVSIQGQLRHPMPKHIYRDNFQIAEPEKCYKDTADRMLSVDVKRIKRSLRIAFIRKYIFKIPFVKYLYDKVKDR